MIPVNRPYIAGGTAPVSYQTLFSFTTDAQSGDTIDWSFTTPSLSIRWIINGNTVDADSVSTTGSTYGLDGTSKTVEVQVIGSSITASRFTANHVTGTATISNVTLDGLDLSDSDTLGTLTYTPSASFNYLDLSNANLSAASDVDLSGLDLSVNSFTIDISSNSLSSTEITNFVEDVVTNGSYATTAGSFTTDNGTFTMSTTELDIGDGNIDSYFNLTNFGLNVDNLVIRIDHNNLSAEDVAHFLDYIDTNSTSGNTGRNIVIDGLNGFIYTAMSPYDGPTAKTNLVGNGWSVSVNEAEVILSATLGLGAADAVDLSATMLNSEVLTWVLPNAAVTANSISAGAGSTYGFDGTDREVKIVVGNASNLSRLNVYGQKMSTYELADNDNYPSGCIIDFGGNVATMGDNKAAFNFIDQTMDLNQGANFTGEINFRADDYDTINTGTGKIYNTRAWTLYMDGTEETQTYPTFPSGTTSADVVFHVPFGEPLLLDSGNPTRATAIIEQESRVLSANAGGYAIYWDDSSAVSSSGYRLRDTENNSNNYYFFFDTAFSLATGTIIFHWSPGASLDGIIMRSGTTDVGSIKQSSGYGFFDCNPTGKGPFSFGGSSVLAQNDAIHAIAWDFPNNAIKIMDNNETVYSDTLTGYGSAVWDFDRIDIVVNNIVSYDLLCLDTYLSDADIVTMYQNVQSKYTP